MANVRKILDNLLAQLMPEVEKAFRIAIQDVTDRAILAEVIKAIEIGDVEGVFRAVGYSEAAMRPIVQQLEIVFETGGVAVGATFPRRLQTPRGATVFRFDVRNARAERYLRDQSSSLVTRIENDVRTNIQNMLNVGVVDGRNPRSVALDIVGRFNTATGHREGGVIGLTSPQEQYIRNARKELLNFDERYFTRRARYMKADSIVQRAINNGEKLDSATIDKIVGRYSDNLLRLRGESIARTETVQSLNSGEYEAYKQASDAGAINKLTRTWDSASDKRTRETHIEADGQTVGLDEFFNVGSVQLMFPGDIAGQGDARELAAEVINCRCRVDTTIDWFEGVK